jgi:hypothetical protein
MGFLTSQNLGLGLPPHVAPEVLDLPGSQHFYPHKAARDEIKVFLAEASSRFSKLCCCQSLVCPRAVMQAQPEFAANWSPLVTFQAFCESQKNLRQHCSQQMRSTTGKIGTAEPFRRSSLTVKTSAWKWLV